MESADAMIIHSMVIANLIDKSTTSNEFKNAYWHLINLIKAKYGKNSDLVDAIEKLEKKPGSEGRMALLKEEIAIASLYKDDEVIKAAAIVNEIFKKISSSKEVIAQYNVENIGIIGNNAKIKGGISFGDKIPVKPDEPWPRK